MWSWTCKADGVTGEEFLRCWAAGVVADGDLEWWPRFSAVVTALDVVDAIDIDVAREIGQSIRAGLTARTGVATPDFFLGSRHFEPRSYRGPIIPPPTACPEVSVRSAAVSLPASVGRGATQFVAVEAGQAWLVCGGPGLAPWDDSDRAAPSPPFLGVDVVVDDVGRRYKLSFRASGAPARGEPRQRWSLKIGIEPTTGDDVKWLELVTAQGPIRAHLRSAVPATVTTVASHPSPTGIEYHLDSELHYQVWLHLLDPDRALPPLEAVIDALTAVAAIDPAHRLARSVRAVDDALAGQPLSPVLPEAVAAALRPTAGTAWLGTEALGVSVQLDGVFMTLEAVIGHDDRFELYFIEPPMAFPPRTDVVSARQLIVWATDNLGGGYIGHAEGGDGEGLYHFRPPLDSSVELLTVHLDGPAHRATVDMDLSGASS